MRGFADDDLRDVVRPRVGEHLAPGALPAERDRLGPELLGEPQVLGDPPPIGLVHPERGGGLDVDRDPVGMERPRHSPRSADEAGRRRGRADADEEPVARRPDPLDAVLGLVEAHLRVDPLGGPSERELAEGNEVPLPEEALDRTLGLLRDVDLPLREPLEELVGREIDQPQLGRFLEHLVRDRLADDDAGDLRDDVVEALDVLDVERGVDVDPGVEELLDVLPPLGVARPGRVRVGELVDQDQPRLAREGAVEIELFDGNAAVLDLPAREELETDHERARVVATVRLDDADDDVTFEIALAPRGLEHRVRLADSGGGAEEDDELAAEGAAVRGLDLAEELVGIAAAVAHRGRRRAYVIPD